MPSQQSFPAGVDPPEWADDEEAFEEWLLTADGVRATVENASFAIFHARFLMKALGDNDRVRAIQAYRAITNSTLAEAMGLVDDILGFRADLDADLHEGLEQDMAQDMLTDPYPEA